MKRVIIGVTSALLALPLAAQMEKPPAAAPARDFQLPATTTIKLANGLQARLVPYGSVPRVTIRVSTLAGSVNESDNDVWLSRFLSKLMQEGTTTRSAEQVALEAARLGGEIEVSPSANVMQVQADALTESAPSMMRLIADVVRNPRLPESESARLRADLSRELSIGKSQPQTLASERFNRQLFGSTPYGRMLPNDTAIAAFNAERARAFYNTNYSAARTMVYVVGNMNVGEMERAIRDAFGDWAAGTAAARPQINATPTPGLFLVDRPKAVQSTVMIGLPVALPSSNDWVAQQVTNALLGGYFSSRITSNIREAKGYTYSPFSTLNTRQNAVAWYEQADVTTNVTGPAIQEIANEIDRLRKEAPSAEELRGVQNYLAGNFILQGSSRGGIINQLQFVDLHGVGEDYLTNYVKRVYAVTPADVQRIAQTYLDRSKMAIVVVGDRAQIEKQLAPFGKIQM